MTRVVLYSANDMRRSGPCFLTLQMMAPRNIWEWIDETGNPQLASSRAVQCNGRQMTITTRPGGLQETVKVGRVRKAVNSGVHCRTP